MGYESCIAYQYLWYKPMVCPEDGFEYYAYVLLYVDDALSVGHEPMAELTKLDNYFKLKDGSIGYPNMYLDAKLCAATLYNGVRAWGISTSKYVQEAVKNKEQYLETNFDGLNLPKRAPKPLSMNINHSLILYLC